MSAIPAYPVDEIAAGLPPQHDEKYLQDADDKLPAGEDDNIHPVHHPEDDPFEVDQNYLVASRSTKLFRGVLFQMILFVSYSGSRTKCTSADDSGGVSLCSRYFPLGSFTNTGFRLSFVGPSMNDAICK